MKKKMYMIGNAHLDPVWLWRWQEGYAENNATLKSMLDRVREFDDVYFTSSSAQFYSWVEQSNPKMFDAIKERIQQGRFELCGGWWVQPDCNLPSGEAFARHSLHAQNYFKDKFGVISKVGYCVDSFGHAGTLPQILKLSRMDSYVFMRPSREEKDIKENLFLWQSKDGSQVMTYRIPFFYNAHFGVEKQIDDCMSEFVGEFDGMMCFYGVGNHGGGPTINNIKTVYEKQKQYANDVDIIFSTPERFFSDVRKSEANLPVVTDDLQHHASGCYSVHSEVKSENKRAENALLMAEKFCVMNELLTQKKTTDDQLKLGWENVLFNQFHDILAGTSIETAYRDARDSYGESCAIADRVSNHAIQQLSFAVDIPHIDGSIPIVVFNSHPWNVESAVEIEWGKFLNTEMPEHFQIEDPIGTVIPHQIIEPQVQCRDRVRVVFKAKVKSMGYALYTIKKLDKNVELEKPIDSCEAVLENEILRIEFDTQKAGIAQIIDKKSGIKFLTNTAACGTISKDTSDTWSHKMLSFHEVCGKFEPQRIVKTETGSVRQSVKIVSSYKNSTISQIFTLYEGSDKIDVRCKVNWQQQLECLKLRFPTAIENPIASYEIPFGTVEKKSDGLEEPMQSFVEVKGTIDGKKAGLLIINDAKYSADVNKSDLGLMVLRSPSYSHHLPMDLVKPYDEYSFIDQGIQSFNYIIQPYVDSCKSPFKTALELNQPPSVVIETYHQGALPKETSLLDVSQENICVTAFKKAYDNNGYILRFFETEGKATNAVIELLGKQTIVEVKPYEIKTLRFAQQGDFVAQTDLLEWENSYKG